VADETTDTATSTETTATTDAAASTEASSATTGSETAASTDAGATDEGSIVGSAGTDSGTGDKGGEAKADGEGGDKDGGQSGATVPETYELKLTATNEAGEETETPLDPALVEAATPLLKDAGLTNEQANKLLPLVPQVQAQLIKQQNDEFAAVRSDWVKQVNEDPELGGKNLPETQRLIAKALDHFGAPSQKDDKGNETNPFRKLLNESGLGNHPDMVRMFKKIGEAASEDGAFIRNTSEPEQRLSREQKLYPEDQPKG
jgi:hypothetical protein